nr:adenosine deaminase [Larsenimonas salina]
MWRPPVNAFLESLPKIELHLHIEGTLEPELMFELARRNDVTLPFDSVEQVRQAYEFEDLQSFLNLYYQGMNVLYTEQDFFDLTAAYLKRCHDNAVMHTELFFDPQAHLARGVSISTQVAGITRALDEAEATYGITSGLILSFLRDMSEEHALETYEAALPYREHFIGVGLDSAEVGNPPEKFERVFERARSDGFHVVVHAGEEGPAEYIKGALEVLKAERIDHGIRSLEDPELAKTLVERRIPLTVCPLSNVYLKTVPDMSAHPLPALIEHGLCVTLHSDDPAYFGGYMNANFLAVQAAFDFSRDTWHTLSLNAVEAAFVNDTRRAALRQRIETYFEQS